MNAAGPAVALARLGALTVVAAIAIMVVLPALLRMTAVAP
jgi:hypothetical protein